MKTKGIELVQDNKTKSVSVVRTDTPLLSKVWKEIQKKIDQDGDCMWTGSRYDKDTKKYVKKNIPNEDVRETLFDRFEEYGNSDGEDYGSEKTHTYEVKGEEKSYTTTYGDDEDDVYDVSKESNRKLVCDFTKLVFPKIQKELNELGILTLTNVSSCGTCSGHLIRSYVGEVINDNNYFYPCFTFHNQGHIEKWFRSLELPFHLNSISSSFQYTFDKKGDKRITKINGKKQPKDMKTLIDYSNESDIEEIVKSMIEPVLTKYGFYLDGKGYWKIDFENIGLKYEMNLDEELDGFLKDLFNDNDVSESLNPNFNGTKTTELLTRI